jgi:hypothetical protein
VTTDRAFKPGLSGTKKHARTLDTRRSITYKALSRGRVHAQVAQLVEQRIENPRVGGSIPPLGTIIPAGTATAQAMT